jgi:hypothetical protein
VTRLLLLGVDEGASTVQSYPEAPLIAGQLTFTYLSPGLTVISLALNGGVSVTDVDAEYI